MEHLEFLVLFVLRICLLDFVIFYFASFRVLYTYWISPNFWIFYAHYASCVFCTNLFRNGGKIGTKIQNNRKKKEETTSLTEEMFTRNVMYQEILTK